MRAFGEFFILADFLSRLNVISAHRCGEGRTTEAPGGQKPPLSRPADSLIRAAECYSLRLVTLIRHGQAGSRQLYDALSPKGHQQAGALGKWLRGRGVHFHRVLTGTLNRQQQTAASLLQAMAQADVNGPQPESDPRWNEFDLDAVYAGIGPALAERDAAFREEYEDLLREMADPRAAVHRHWRRCDVTVVRAWIEISQKPEGQTDYAGESFADFSTRVRAAFLDLPPAENIAVVTSATPIALCAALALDLGPRRVMQLAAAQHNTAYSEMDARPGDPRLASFNNTPHLSDDMKTLR